VQSGKRDSAWVAVRQYGTALLIVGVALLIRWPAYPWLGGAGRISRCLARSPSRSGWRVGGLRTVGAIAGFLIANYFLARPTRGFVFDDFIVFELAGYALSARFIIFFGETMHRAREREGEQKNLLAVTLASIGDGVIATDSSGRVIFLNAEAQRLTGWRGDEATGRPLLEVFRIVNERTQQPAEDPAERVLRTGKAVGLANHTVLVSKGGRRTPIDDSAAPIRLAGGSVFRRGPGFFEMFTNATKSAGSQRAARGIVQSSGTRSLRKAPEA